MEPHLATGPQFYLATLLTASLTAGLFIHLNLNPVTHYAIGRTTVGWPFVVDDVSTNPDRERTHPTILKWHYARRAQILNLLVAMLGIGAVASTVEVVSRHGIRGVWRRVLFWKWAHPNTNVLAAMYSLVFLAANIIPEIIDYNSRSYWFFGWPYTAVYWETSESGMPSVVGYHDHRELFGNLIIFVVGLLSTIYFSQRLTKFLRDCAFWLMTNIGAGLLIIYLLLARRMPWSGDTLSLPYSISRDLDFGRMLFQPPQCFNFLIIAAVAIISGAVYEFYLRRRDRLASKNT
jgi:hypothetical protein